MSTRLLLRLLCLSFFFTCVQLAPAQSQSPMIHHIEILTPTVERFGKFEARIELDAQYSNPYNYEQVVVGAQLIGPSGSVSQVDGFYMQDYHMNTPNGTLIAQGSGEFRIRFSPKEIGTYSLVVSVKDVNGTGESAAYHFTAIPNSSDHNHGFVRTRAHSNYLEFDDGSQYIPIGENMAWPSNNPYTDYTKWLHEMSESGGNFFRLWHAPWGLGIEWNEGNSFEGLRKYKQSNCYYQDWLYEFGAQYGIYIMLTIHHHGAVSTGVNPNWQDSPYNVANGGPCSDPADFFSNAAAIAHTKNRLRYIVARWGYARSILCWELFNEVHWADHFQANHETIAEWHFEMGEYLKTIDPNQHLITTSYGNDWKEGEAVWSSPDFGFTQSHLYQNTPNLEKLLATTSRSFLQEFEKPTLNGEFGLGTSASAAYGDPDGIHIHNALWGGLFGGGLGTAMSWWWDNFMHPKDLYYHFTGIRKIVDQIDFVKRRLTPVMASVDGVPDDLSIGASLDWGSTSTDSITIGSDGSIEPINAQLSQFLYGARWNTEHRNPPVFSVTYPKDGEFSVTTGSGTGNDPRIEIWLDDRLILREDATTNTTYTISVPPGPHQIRVDNQGADWIKISQYTFENLGSKLEAYVLKSAENDYAAGWIMQKDYNHQYVADYGVPNATPAASLNIPGFEDGEYALHLFDPHTGYSIANNHPAIAQNGILHLPVPAVIWDLAFIINGTTVSTSPYPKELAFKVFPNPVAIGGAVHLQLDNSQAFDLTIIDLQGRIVLQQRNTQEGQFNMPSKLAEGHYWVRVDQKGQSGLHSIVVVDTP